MYYFLSIISLITSLAVILAPVILYFSNKNNKNFAKQITIIAIVDAVYLFFWILRSYNRGGIGQSPNSVIEAIIFIVSTVAILYCVWKMKDGNKFKSLFKNPGVNGVLFVVYMLTNFVIFYELAITLINYLIFGGIFIVLIWIVNHFVFTGVRTSKKEEGIPNRCDSCIRYQFSKCIENPSAMISPMDSCSEYSPRP